MEKCEGWTLGRERPGLSRPGLLHSCCPSLLWGLELHFPCCWLDQGSHPPSQAVRGSNEAVNAGPWSVPNPQAFLPLCPPLTQDPSVLLPQSASSG